MGKRIAAGILAFCAAAAFAGGARAGETGGAPAPRIDSGTKWLCYYGDDRRVLDVDGYDLLILESEAIGDLSPGDRKGRLCVGYMSIGEAERNRRFYPDIRDKPWVLDENPDWPESRLVDPRSGEWRDLVVNHVAAGIVDAGYDGFLLDNVDTAEELLRRDGGVYAGADEAAAAILRALRETYPDKVIIANGGLSVVPLAHGSVDAVMYEGVYSTWLRKEDGTFGYGRISPQSRAWLRPRLLRLKAAGIPVLALDYADPDDPEAVREAYDALRKEGNNPYVSERALDTFPGSASLPPPEEDCIPD